MSLFKKRVLLPLFQLHLHSLFRRQRSALAAEQGKLALVTGSALYHSGTLSQYGEGPMHVCPEGYIELSRTDASAYKIAENDLITVSSATGSMQLKAKVTSRMPAGVVFRSVSF